MIIFTILERTRSQRPINALSKARDTSTVTVDPINSSLVGQATLDISTFTSFTKPETLFAIVLFKRAFARNLRAFLSGTNLAQQNWQARRDSNPQHAVLETAALPIGATGLRRHTHHNLLLYFFVYGMFSAKFTELTAFQLVRILLLILCGRIVPVLAFRTFECDLFLDHLSTL